MAINLLRNKPGTALSGSCTVRVWKAGYIWKKHQAWIQILKLTKPTSNLKLCEVCSWFKTHSSKILLLTVLRIKISIQLANSQHTHTSFGYACSMPWSKHMEKRQFSWSTRFERYVFSFKIILIIICTLRTAQCSMVLLLNF